MKRDSEFKLSVIFYAGHPVSPSGMHTVFFDKKNNRLQQGKISNSTQTTKINFGNSFKDQLNQTGAIVGIHEHVLTI